MDLSCSFCSTPKGEVRRLIGGTNGYICDECVLMCLDILTDGTGEHALVKLPPELAESFHQVLELLRAKPNEHAKPKADRSTEAAPKEAEVRHQIGAYEILECLGPTSLGMSYLCCAISNPSELVRLKILYPELTKDDIARKRFMNEINATLKVQHRNVVQGYECVREGEALALAMEHVDGSDLATELDEFAPLAIPRVLQLIQQILAGLEAIHAEGIIHRDLKPENILLTSEGDVKISDFGVARLGSGPRLTHQGNVLGAIDFVAPEYLDQGDIDQRSDLYAVGILGYEMLTGTSPFKADTLIAAMHQRLHGVPPLVTEARPDCPADLSALIARALERDPAKRFQSAELMNAALAAVGQRLASH